MDKIRLNVTPEQFSWILGSLRRTSRQMRVGGILGATPETDVFSDGGTHRLPSADELDDLATALNSAAGFAAAAAQEDREACNTAADDGDPAAGMLARSADKELAEAASPVMDETRADTEIIHIFDALLTRVHASAPSAIGGRQRHATAVLATAFSRAAGTLAGNRPAAREAALMYAQAFADVAARIKQTSGGGDTPYLIIQPPSPPLANAPHQKFSVVYSPNSVMALYIRTSGGTEWVGVGGSMHSGIIVPAPSMAKFVNAQPVFKDLAAALSKTGMAYVLQPGAVGWSLCVARDENRTIPLGGGGEMPIVPSWPFCGVHTPVFLDAGSTTWKDSGHVHESQR